MPLYDFQCRACGLRFEALVRGSIPVTCPSCAAVDPERQPVAAIGVSSEATRGASLTKARRAGRKVSRDKAMAEAEYAIKHRH
jgi:putative FmdB family regulatory protein